MCRPNSSMPSRQLFQQDALRMQQKPASSSSMTQALVSTPPPTMMGPLSLPPIRPATRPCKMVEITEAIMLPSISMDMDEPWDEDLKMLRPRFSQGDFDMDTFE